MSTAIPSEAFDAADHKPASRAADVARFWTTSRGLFFALAFILATAIFELPGLLLMHGPDGADYRSIYGLCTVRLAIALSMEKPPSLNIFGWLTDFDKWVPYVGTALALLTAWRATSYTSPLGAVASRITAPNTESYIVGMIGAVLIVIHYVLSGSGHFTSEYDKGLIDSIRHLAHGTHFLHWMGLLLYRLSYLIMSPLVYFLLFACLWSALRALNATGALRRRIAQSNDADKVTRIAYIDELRMRLWSVAAIPGTLFALVHLALSARFGIERYAINTSMRGVIVILLTLALIYSSCGVGVRLTIRALVRAFIAWKGVRHKVRDIVVVCCGLLWLTGAIDRCTALWKQITDADLPLVTPSSDHSLNHTAGLSFNCFVLWPPDTDPRNFDRAVHSLWRHDPFPSAMHTRGRALVLAMIGLERLGVPRHTINEIAAHAEGHPSQANYFVQAHPCAAAQRRHPPKWTEYQRSRRSKMADKLAARCAGAARILIQSSKDVPDPETSRSVTAKSADTSTPSEQEYVDALREMERLWTWLDNIMVHT